jgi:hypothetical protein
MVKYIDNDFLIANKTIYNIEYSFVRWFRYLSVVVVILYIVGFFTTTPVGLVEINFVFKFLIALFLLYRFNGYRKNITLTALDKEAAFLAGEYLLIIALIDILSGYTDAIRPKILVYTQPIVNYIKQYTHF